MNLITIIIAPFKALWRAIVFIVKDTVDDWKFLGKAFNGEYKPKYTLKEIFNFEGYFKKNWMFLLILGLAYASGYFLAALKYERLANEAIMRVVAEYEGVYIPSDGFIANIPKNITNISNFLRK